MFSVIELQQMQDVHTATPQSSQLAWRAVTKAVLQLSWSNCSTVPFTLR
jgi:hypothetical protein